MQHAVAIAQAGHALVVEQVGVDTRRLRRDVGTYAHRPAGKLIDQLEGAQVQILAGAGQQRLQVFQHRRHDKFETASPEMIQDGTAQLLDASGFRRQGISDVFR